MKSESEIEKKTIEKVIEIYCNHKHDIPHGLCDDCSELLGDAIHLINKCQHKPKPACGACKTNCFSSDQRKKMKGIMKYSGPKMLFRHPVLTINHFWKLRLMAS